MINTIENVSDKEWDFFVNKDENSTFFQTREWFSIWKQYDNFQNETKIVSFRNGKKVLLPLASKKIFNGLFKFCTLSPKGYGDFLADEELDHPETIEVFNYIKKNKNVYFSMNPFRKSYDNYDQYTGKDFTQCIDLQQKFDKIFDQWSKHHIRSFKKGTACGVTVEKAQKLEDWRMYFLAYEDSISRWGKQATNHYRWKLFEIIHKLRSNKIELWIAKHKENIISGVLCFYHNRHVAYWHGANFYKYFDLRGSHVLHYHIIKDACNRGFYYYDLLPSGGHEGVIRFKNGFSPQKKQLYVYMPKYLVILNSIQKNIKSNARFIKTKLSR